MKMSEAKKYAMVERNGAICLGKHTVCDGAVDDRKIGVFTHIHDDHINMFNAAMHNCSRIYVSKPTLDMLAALEMSEDSSMDPRLYFEGRHIEALDFNKQVRPKLDKYSDKSDYGDLITLYRSKHILGSAQVLLKTKDDGVEVAYTSDFAAGTEAIPCDVLVLDPTHGDPSFNTVVERESLENRLVELVDEAIQNGIGVVVNAHIGRLQYTMHLLSKRLSDDVQFISSQKNIRLAEVYKKHNMPIREIVELGSFNALVAMESCLYVRFESGRRQSIEEIHRTMGNNEIKSKSISRQSMEEIHRTMGNNEIVISIGGNRLENGTVIQFAKNGNCKVEFMDHANFDYIINFVQKANPKWVVLDHTRSKQADTLAKHLQNENINVIW